jgi:FKBP-type peptidyl-prolyl cis-trans isomerase FklB
MKAGFLALLVAGTLSLPLTAGLSATKIEKVIRSSEFMKRNARQEGIITIPGIQYRVLKSGDSTRTTPRSADTVIVHYEGKLPSGAVFDSSFERGEPATLVVRQVIPGWQVILKMMSPGDEWEVFIPSELAYGAKGTGPIPPDSALVFRIQLIEVKPSEVTTPK